VIGNDHFFRRLSIRRSILYAISQASRSLEIINPYFLPDPGIVRALRKAVERGVCVQIILPAWTDVPIVDLASKVVQRRLLRRGILLYRWRGFVHAKAVIVDRTWVSVGSYNFDYRSLLHNLEVMVESVGEGCGNEAGEMFEKDLGDSIPVSPEEWQRLSLFTRGIARLLYAFRFFL
jgi:cardiolipin synthase